MLRILQVTVVFFDNYVHTPSPEGQNCYQTKLALATPNVKKALNKFIDDTEHTDRSNNWKVAFKRAFEFLEESELGRC